MSVYRPSIWPPEPHTVSSSVTIADEPGLTKSGAVCELPPPPATDPQLDNAIQHQLPITKRSNDPRSAGIVGCSSRVIKRCSPEVPTGPKQLAQSPQEQARQRLLSP